MTYRLVPASATYSQFSDLVYHSLGVNVNANTVRDAKGATRDASTGHTLTPFYLTPGATASAREYNSGTGGASGGDNSSGKGGGPGQGQGNTASRFFKEMVLKPGTCCRIVSEPPTLL